MSPQPQVRPRPREWEVDLVRPVVEDGQVVGLELDRAACADAFAEIDAIIFRLGGAVLVAGKREEQEDGSWVTTGLRISYESFMPPASRQEPGPRQEAPPGPRATPAPEPEPEPAAPFSPEPAQPGPQEEGPPPVSAEAGTEAELEPAGAGAE